MTLLVDNIFVIIIERAEEASDAVREEYKETLNIFYSLHRKY